MTSSTDRPQVAKGALGGVEALPDLWRAAAQDPNYTPSAYMPDQYRAAALTRCAADLEALLSTREVVEPDARRAQELDDGEEVGAEQAVAPVMPLVEAMDYFDRFWNARTPGGDWTVIGSDCECGNCHSCGMSSVLSWTHALLSNPSLAGHAEMRTKKRPGE